MRSGAAVAGVTVDGTAALVGGTIYRYSFVGSFGIGPVTVDFIAGSWMDIAGNANLAITETFTVRSPTVLLSLSSNPLAEAGGVATLTAALSAVSTQAVTVDLGFSGTAMTLWKSLRPCGAGEFYR